MQMVEAGAGVQTHAQVFAETWQKCFGLICGKQLCQQIGREEPFSIKITPSKRSATDPTLMEYKVDICHDLAEKIDLHSLLQDGQFCVYPVNEFIRVRVKGCKGIIELYRAHIKRLRLVYPQWASNFRWPSGRYH